MVRIPEVDDSLKRMQAHSIVGETKSSWAITCKKLLEDIIRIHGIGSYKNIRQKRDRTENEKRTYYLQDMEDGQTIGLKKQVVGLEIYKYMGISSMYNFRCD